MNISIDNQIAYVEQCISDAEDALAHFDGDLQWQVDTITNIKHLQAISESLKQSQKICLQSQIDLLYSFDLGSGFILGKQIAERTIKLQEQLNQLE